MNIQLYDTDFYAWTVAQSEFLQNGEWRSLDIQNLVEEVESLGRQQRQELRNRLGILIGHLLKWQYQAELRSKSWRATIREQRKIIIKLLEENPSLKSYLSEAIADSYDSALAIVVRETPLDYQNLPLECPYCQAKICDLDFPEDLN
jgi:hypothetical protein